MRLKEKKIKLEEERLNILKGVLEELVSKRRT